ncbi:MAG: hypothetical protein ACYSW8_18700 [Planctomycetota bacterium]|jgi:hypothetical protein
MTEFGLTIKVKKKPVLVEIEGTNKANKTYTERIMCEEFEEGLKYYLELHRGVDFVQLNVKIVGNVKVVGR